MNRPDRSAVIGRCCANKPVPGFGPSGPGGQAAQAGFWLDGRANPRCRRPRGRFTVASRKEVTITAMTNPLLHLHSTVVSCPGFVVAMRAKLIAESYPETQEWLIVSRWGTGGEHLSMAWTALTAVAGDAPIGLMPRQTALAIQDGGACSGLRTTFRLASALPDRLSVAGAFVPAQGYIRLYGEGPRLHIRSEGTCTRSGIRDPWHIEADRASWIGEFVEAQGW